MRCVTCTQRAHVFFLSCEWCWIFFPMCSHEDFTMFPLNYHYVLSKLPMGPQHVPQVPKTYVPQHSYFPSPFAFVITFINLIHFKVHKEKPCVQVRFLAIFEFWNNPLLSFKWPYSYLFKFFLGVFIDWVIDSLKATKWRPPNPW